MELFISEVISVDDSAGGRRIKARVMPADRPLKDADIPYAFPAMPKLMHVMPKVGEAVIIITEGDAKTQRYYLGPIISQDQYMEHDDFAMGATSLLKGGLNQHPDYVPSNDRSALGALADDEDVAIYGRTNTDIILKEDELHIRSGSRLTKNNRVSFNREAPSFVKLKYYEEPLKQTTDEVSHKKTKSTALVVADKIILASPSGDGGVNISNNGELVTDKELIKMIDRIHMLPYGDILCDFLYMFLKMFKEHTHKYHNMPTSPLEPAHLAFDKKYGSSLENIEKKLLSKDIGIN